MGRRGKQEYHDIGPSSNLSESPKFFKIVVNPEDDKLRIPTGFVEKYGRLPDMVTVKDPVGTVRQLELTELDGETWFYNGWGEFKDYYSISFGHLLVFEYDGKAHFDVFIFDMTAMEIEYPLDVASEDDLVPGTHMNESESDDDSAAILKEVHTTPKRKRKRNYGKAVDNSCRVVKGQLSKKKRTKITEECHQLRRIMDKENCATYTKAKALVFENPICIKIMQPSYVTHCLSVPLPFTKKHLPKKHNKLKLQVQDVTWTVAYVLGPCNTKLTIGWKKFVKDNALKVGDTCVFEVNKCKKCLWNVTVLRS